MKNPAPLSKDHSLRQIRWLTNGLILSTALNVGLFLTFVVTLFRQDARLLDYEQSVVEGAVFETARPVGGLVALAPNAENERVLRILANATFQELLETLRDTRLVSDGYRMRDLALSVLVSDKDFHVESALQGENIARRRFALSQGEKEYLLFPGLSERHFAEIIHYAETEQWPFTAKGLYKLLRATPLRSQAFRSLSQAFYLSPEYLRLEALFAQEGQLLPRRLLLALIMDGEWNRFYSYFSQRSILYALTPEMRRNMLVDYVRHEGSKTAAHLLLWLEESFVLKRLDDETLLQVLSLLEGSGSSAVEDAARTLLRSPRGEAVHQLAKRIAGEQGGLLQNTVQEDAPPAAQVYIVQEGDTLWEIAQVFRVEVSQIQDENHLAGDSIYTGMRLRIPRSYSGG